MMRLKAITALAALVLCAGLAMGAERSVVLVTSVKCQMEDISMLDIRKAYLGVDVSYKGNVLQAFRHDADEQLQAVFLQNVVAMSERTYERRLLRLLLKSGRPRPPQINSDSELEETLNAVPCGISYMWKQDADGYATLKVLKVLWQEN